MNLEIPEAFSIVRRYGHEDVYSEADEFLRKSGHPVEPSLELIVELWFFDRCVYSRTYLVPKWDYADEESVRVELFKDEIAGYMKEMLSFIKSLSSLERQRQT
jgi:hypothetical protein